MKTFIHTWSLVDKLYFCLTRLEYVNQSEKNIFRVKPLYFRGDTLSLSDGFAFHHNDLLLKIHLHNCQLLKEMMTIQNDVKRALYVYDRVEKSLPGLAQYVASHPKEKQIKGILGVTLLTRGVRKLGFEVREIRNPFYLHLKQAYLKPMFLLCHPNWRNMAKDKDMVPKFLVMSKEKLLEHYLPSDDKVIT
ncbi:YkoP family protein [Brevibacillus borstelensis]|uniref:YkoP family protein n=1 Tax=Brevibacillus borstelensis TaxID=45462 RepID=UPI0030BBE9C7